MYCHQCGARVEGRPRFCHLCGTSLTDPSRAPAPQPREVHVRVPQLSIEAGRLAERGRWRGISGGGGLLILVAFFLPWVSASCDPRSGYAAQNQTVLRFSGFNLAVGPRIESVFGVQQAPGSVMLWLVPAAALAIIACALFVAHQKVAAGAALAAALTSLLPMLSTWQSWESQRSGFISISVEVGLWLSLLGVILGAIGGLVGLSVSTERRSPGAPGGRPFPSADLREVEFSGHSTPPPYSTGSG